MSPSLSCKTRYFYNVSFSYSLILLFVSHFCPWIFSRRCLSDDFFQMENSMMVSMNFRKERIENQKRVWEKQVGPRRLVTASSGGKRLRTRASGTAGRPTAATLWAVPTSLSRSEARSGTPTHKRRLDPLERRGRRRGRRPGQARSPSAVSSP